MGRRSILWYVFAGSRGGNTRMCIVEHLLKKPENARQLSLDLGVDYSTITHSLRVLEKNRLAYAPEKGYGAKYVLTPEFLTMQDEFEKLRRLHTCIRKIPQKTLKEEAKEEGR